MSPTWRVAGALTVAAAVFYYGTTSEVAWLFLLAYWIVALVVVAYFYARWNWRGLRADLGLGTARPGPDSPIEALPEQLLRSGPLPGPVFEGDQADMYRRTNSGEAVMASERTAPFDEIMAFAMEKVPCAGTRSG